MPHTPPRQHIPAPADPVAPARRSAQARAKDAGKHTPAGLPDLVVAGDGTAGLAGVATETIVAT